MIQQMGVMYKMDNKNQNYRDFFHRLFFSEIIKQSKEDAQKQLEELNKNYKIVVKNDNVFIFLNNKPYAAWLGGEDGLKFADEKIKV